MSAPTFGVTGAVSWPSTGWPVNQDTSGLCNMAMVTASAATVRAEMIADRCWGLIARPPYRREADGQAPDRAPHGGDRYPLAPFAGQAPHSESSFLRQRPRQSRCVRQ